MRGFPVSASLYERLGGAAAITSIANDIVDLHRHNPRVAPRFAGADAPTLKRRVATFFSMGTGGPSEYEGRAMLEAHRGMNIDCAEFIAVLDDALEALRRHGVGQREQEEVLFILYGMKADIVKV